MKMPTVWFEVRVSRSNRSDHISHIQTILMKSRLYYGQHTYQDSKVSVSIV